MRSLAADMRSLNVDSLVTRRPTEPVSALNVLIIENNYQYGDLLWAQLADAGHRPTIARDGTSGLRLARELAPDAVLLDHELPEMRGYDLARLMQQEGILPPTSILVIVTGEPSDQLEDAIAVGANLLLRKPIAAESLPGLIGCVHALRQRKLRFATPVDEAA